MKHVLLIFLLAMCGGVLLAKAIPPGADGLANLSWLLAAPVALSVVVIWWLFVKPK